MLRYGVILFALLLSSTCFAQSHDKKAKVEGFYHFFYKDKPDSIFLNGELQENITPGIRYTLPNGTYEIRAVKECRVTYIDSVLIIPNGITRITILFKKRHVPRLKAFWATQLIHLASGVTAATLVSSFDKGPKFGKQTLTTGLLAYTIWFLQTHRKFDRCNGIFSGRKNHQNGWRVRLEMAGLVDRQAMASRGDREQFLFENPNGPDILFIYDLNSLPLPIVKTMSLAITSPILWHLKRIYLDHLV